MKTYSYTALDEWGGEHRGVRLAHGKRELSKELLNDGLLLDHARSHWGNRASRAQTVEALMARLELLLRANISVVDALELLGQTAPKDCRSLSITLLEHIRAGSRFSDAVTSMPQFFDPLCIALLGVGERSGELRSAVNNVKLQLEWQRSLRTRLRRVLGYPLLVSCVLLLVIAFLLTHVVPAFGDLLTGLGRSLPLQTRALLWLSTELDRIGWWLLVFFGLLLVAVFLLTRFYRSRLWLRRCQIKLPFVGAVILQIRLSRFSKAMAELTTAKIDLLKAIEICKAVLECEYLEQVMDNVHSKVLDGASLSSAVLEQALLPDDYARLLQLGEVSGQLPEMFMQLGDIYDGASRSQIELIESVATPVLMAILGGLLMWIVLAVLGPIYDVLSTVGSF